MGLILVDSSVWIDLIGARDTIHTRFVRAALRKGDPLGIGDLMLVEVLQGARSDGAFEAGRALLNAFVPVTISDHRVAAQAARHYRFLRSRGITPRKTIDTLIATRCILDDIPLLYADRDFDPFVQHLGLRPALDAVSGVS